MNLRNYVYEADIHYLEELHELHNDLPLLPEITKVEFVVHIRKLKQESNHGLVLTKMHRFIKFNQKAWLKPYIDMNTKLEKKAKNGFEKDFFKLINNSVFGKTMENVRKNRDIKRKQRRKEQKQERTI